MAHKHTFKTAARFKWLSGRWFRRYLCECGAGWFGKEHSVATKRDDLLREGE